MSVNVYTPDPTKIIHNTSVDFVSRYISAPVHLVQFDNSMPIIEVKLYSNGTPYVIPAGMNVNIRTRKPDGNVIYNPVLGCDSTRTIVYVEATQQMCAAKGDMYPIIEIADLVNIAASGYFYVQIDTNPVNAGDIESTPEAKAIQDFVDVAKSWAVGDTGVRVDEDTDNAKYYAGVASMFESDASVHANDAIKAAIDAKTAELDAATHVGEAEDFAKESESWAIGGTGTRAGEDTDNSKYYSDQAAQAVSDANDNATLAESWAIGGTGTRAGEDTDNSKYYAAEAAVSEVAATNSAAIAATAETNATNKAIEAESWAIGGTGTRTGEDTDNAKYWAAQAKAIAGIGIATNTTPGIIKPDGTTTTVDPDGTLHAVGGGSGSGGDMYKKDYAKKGIANTVDKADEANVAAKVGSADTAVLEKLTDNGGQLEYNGSPIGGVVEVDNSTIKENASGELEVPIDKSTIVVEGSKVKVGKNITDRLPKTKPTASDEGKVPTVQNDGSIDWGNGGHEMLSTVSDVEAITSPTDEHVVSAHVVKNYSNRYTLSVFDKISAYSDKVVITDKLFEDDDATYEFMYEPTLNAKGEYEVLTLGKYTLDTSTGTFTIEVVEAPTVDTNIRIDVTVYRAVDI